MDAAGLNLVVGSGPSGVAAAAALLDAGREVLLLDAGLALEPERAALAARLAARDPGDWSAAERERAREALDPAWAPKRVFGSSFPYALGPESGLDQRGTRCLVSHARGGLSTVWGAATLPFPGDELDGWPVTDAELAPHYARAASLLRIAGARDGLETLFPFHATPRPGLPLSRQARAALSRFEARADALKAAGFAWGAARHAADAALCREAAACLSGCPYGAVWSAADALEELRRRPGFRYEPGARVLAVEERGDGVRAHAARAGASRTTYDAARVFLACGPLATARLVLASFGAPDRALSLLTQPYFLLPLLMDAAPEGAPEPRLHTLAQLFLELKDDAVSKRLLHLQIYGHNEFVAERLSWLPGFLARPLAARLLAAQGYLHSNEGAPVAVEPSGRGEDLRLRLTAGPPRAKAAARRAAAALSRAASDLGLTPLTPLMRVGLPGEGNHIGGIFPMRAAPGPWETDRQGRLGGRGRVFLADASILPSLPASTITYATMANASRVATEAVS